MASTSADGYPIDASQVIEVLLNELRALSTESRRKHEKLKNGAESVIVLVRNIATNTPPEILHSNLINKSVDIVQPFLIGCSTKNPRIVQISLQAIQKALQYRIVHKNAAPAIVDQLWELAEAECEELRVLQTITPFVSSELLVTGSSLAKCILIAIKLNFSKDPSVINAASAAVRQLFSCVFERVVQEDGINSVPILSFPLTSELDYAESYGSENSAEVGLKMDVCAADGYLLLKDLLSLIRRESTFWLEGVKRFTVTLALELLESVIKNYPSVFFRHVEYAVVLRDLIYPLVMQVMLGSKKNKSKNDTTITEKPPFPLQMRCFRIGLVIIRNYYSIIGCDCKIFLSSIVELLSSNKTEWQAAAALEVIHKLVGQPELLRFLFEKGCSASDEKPIVQSIIEGVASYNNRTIKKAVDDDPLEQVDQQQPGFLCGDTFLPLHENVTAKKWILLDWLEKHEASSVPIGYSLSLAYATLTDFTNSMFGLIEELNSPSNDQSNGHLDNCKISADFFRQVYPSLISGLVHLLIASIEDSITESLLNCLSTLVMIACRTKVVESIEALFRVLCRFALPADYFFDLVANECSKCLPTQNNNSYSNRIVSNFCLDHIYSANGKLDQVVAVSSGCPTPADPNPRSYSLMSKNMDVARTLISAVSINGCHLESTWDMILTTLQHFTWLLGMKPLPTGGFRDGSTMDSSTPVPGNVLTTAVTNELPEFFNMLTKLFDSTINYSDVTLHHVIAALCKLSSDQMSIAQKAPRGPSYFGVGLLAQLGIINQFRIEVFWRPVTAHLIDISNHFDTKLREFGSCALNHLITSSFKYLLDEMQKAKNSENTTSKTLPAEFEKRQTMIMNAVVRLSDIPYPDVKERQLNCVGYVLQCGSGYLFASNWALVIHIIQRIAADVESTEHLIELTFSTCSQICSEFLDALPFDCLLSTLKAVTYFGQQRKVVNSALNSIGLLWQISDHISLVASHFSPPDFQEFWFVFFECLSWLCVDPRPPLRKSACDTMMQTIACHGDVVDSTTWHRIFYNILFPLNKKILDEAKNASSERVSASNSEALLVHHSRDTPAKQWAETAVRNISGLVRIFNSQREKLHNQDDFFEKWTSVLQILESAICFNNSEISLAGLNAFLELHFGRNAPDALEYLSPRKKNEDVERRETSHDGDNKQRKLHSGNANGIEEDNDIFSTTLPNLPEMFYTKSFEICRRIGSVLTSTVDERGQPRFLPNSFHFATYLRCFLILFSRVKTLIPNSHLKYDEFLITLKRIACAPRSPDQQPFALTTSNAELSPAHEAIYEVLKVIVKENLRRGSAYRDCLPDTFKLLFEFTNLSVHPPVTDFVAVYGKTSLSSAPYNLVPFAHLCLKIAVDSFRKCFSWQNIIDSQVFVDFINTLREPLILRYNLSDPNIWITAATAFAEVSRISFGVVRENIGSFNQLWTPFADTMNKFIFCKNRGQPFHADERRRYEFHDCQMIEVIRQEILKYASKFPWDFMQQIIGILNRASIITVDHSDVMALDLCEQRTDLCRVSFAALLSLCNTQVPSYFANNFADDQSIAEKPKSLGAYAISLILLRCQKVLNDYARDERNCGMVPLSVSRVCELVSVLRAIGALIEDLVKQPKEVIDSLYGRLVDLYPVIVQMIPCCAGNSDVQLSVMIALNSYQTLLKIRN